MLNTKTYISKVKSRFLQSGLRTKNSIAICFILLVSLTAVNNGFSQFNYKVEGTVKNNGKALSGADVTLENGNGKVKQLTTSSSGSFTFPLEANQEYTVFISKTGYTKVKILYSTMVFSDEEEQKVKGVSKPEVEIFELPSDPTAVDKINEMLEKPYLSYYYSSDKSTLISDEIYDNALPQTIAKLQKISGDAGKKDAETKTLDEKYSKVLSKADKYFEAKDYTNAKTAYNEALTLKPKEEYPKTKLSEINKAISEIEQKEKEKADAIAAEKSRLEKEKADAMSAEEARKAKEKADADAKEQERIAKAKALADAEELERLDKEKAAKEATDKARSEKEKAIAEANEKERLKKEAEEKIVNEKYQTAITNGDSAFVQKDYNNAKTFYTSAMSIKSSETYPQDKLTEIETILDAKRKAEYTNELAKKYPEGVTEEKSKEGNNMVTKRIVVKGSQGTMYIKKETNFGTTYYFKDAAPITEKQFNDETQVK